MVAVALTAGAVSGAAGAQRPLNLDFERSSVADPARPWGWTLGWSAFAAGPDATFSLDRATRHGGDQSLQITVPDSAGASEPRALMLQVPAAFALGHMLRLTGWLKGERLRGRALVTLEAWKDRAFAAADTAYVASGPATGTADWSSVELAISVPRDSTVHSVVITAALDGSGTAWFDDFALHVDDVPVTATPAVAAPPSAEDLDWLARHATPLTTVHRASDSAAEEDFEAFAGVVGTARVVALGESTHGTREFFLLKHRILDYLVRELGFTVFAIEANQLAVERINRYVHGGPGTARDVMRVMFRVWNTEAMLDLIEWMRRYNGAHPDRPVRFAGYDMQDHRTPADTLRAFLARVEPALVGRFDSLAGEYRAQPSYATPQIADTVRVRWSDQAGALWRTVDAHRAAWLARAETGDDSLAVVWAVQAATLLRQAAGFNVALSSPERDSLMAANLDWVLRVLVPGARAVVWAHDVHVSRGGDLRLSFNGGAQMGAYLSRIYGSDYRAFSLLTYDGAYRATASFVDHRMIEAEAFAGPPGSLEAALHALERRPSSVGWLVDLRAAWSDDGGAWLRRPRPIRHVGYAAYDYGFELSAVLPLEFDGVLFVDHTTPTRLLR